MPTRKTPPTTAHTTKTTTTTVTSKTTTAAAAPATTTASKTRTSIVRTVGPAIPLAIAMLGTSVLPSARVGGPASPGAAAVSEVGKPSKIFTPACDLPFKGDRQKFDDICGIAGGSPDPADQAESMAKNNFCAPAHDPEVLTYKNLTDLQTEATNKGIGKKLEDRKDVQNLGEGNYVSYIAVIKDAHYSDVSGGEKVNCNQSGNPPNDIHIVLMPDPNDPDECHSTTAEMSPHYRPTNWTPTTLKNLGKPVRIKGQLFYDNSHTPCGAHSSNPKRISLWEVHPVYSIDVCKMSDLKQCQASTSAADWTPVE